MSESSDVFLDFEFFSLEGRGRKGTEILYVFQSYVSVGKPAGPGGGTVYLVTHTTLHSMHYSTSKP